MVDIGCEYRNSCPKYLGVYDNSPMTPKNLKDLCDNVSRKTLEGGNYCSDYDYITAFSDLVFDSIKQASKNLSNNLCEAEGCLREIHKRKSTSI
ncbi:MAG TPA: hypothetical protein VJB35_00630 [Candidatus Nanoarchaeia archaeon]|nr:hypothetical protein [Candidatus Nanoarchaeia archaeon]